jgi:hypothetical protein
MTTVCTAAATEAGRTSRQEVLASGGARLPVTRPPSTSPATPP